MKAKVPAAQVVLPVSDPLMETVAPASQDPARDTESPAVVNGFVAGEVITGALGAVASRIQVTEVAVEVLP